MKNKVENMGSKEVQWALINKNLCKKLRIIADGCSVALQFESKILFLDQYMPTSGLMSAEALQLLTRPCYFPSLLPVAISYITQ